MELSCGIDIIEIMRIKKAIDDSNEKFLSKVFTPAEIEYCEARSAAKFQHYAARFAAKEAAAKALGLGFAKGVWWTDIEVVKDDNGKPMVKLYGQAKKTAEDLGIKTLNLSLSHCHEYAVANVVCILHKL